MSQGESGLYSLEAIQNGQTTIMVNFFIFYFGNLGYTAEPGTGSDTIYYKITLNTTPHLFFLQFRENNGTIGKQLI